MSRPPDSRPTGPTRSLDPVLGALRLCVWERRSPAEFRAVSPKPPALLTAFPNMASAGVDLAKQSPFLAHFLEDAETHWASRGETVLSSGPWTEPTENGEPLALAAVAFCCEETDYIVLELLGSSHGELTRILQSAREGSLAYERLAKTERALRESEERYRQLSSELEQRVQDRTAELRHEIAQHLRTQEKLLRHQEDLRSLTDELVLAEERERRRIAVGLHDDVGQSLAVAKMRLGALQETLTGVTEQREIEAVRQFLGESIQRTRSLTFELASPVLHEAGLVPALASLVEQTENQHSFSIDFIDDGTAKTISGNAAILTYQAVRELLHNIVKHAKATHVTLTSSRMDEHVVVSVRDNGCGFEWPLGSARSAAAGFGLFNVRERLERLGGKVEIESTPGVGTRVSLQVPSPD